MKWHEHYQLQGKHAFLSPSKYSWINYDPEKLRTSYINHKKAQEGTALHAFASMAINSKIKLANHKKAINQFVNDAIGFDMESEMVLYYSDNCFGTADAIHYDELSSVLRVHDLKTGVSPASFNQLLVYCALFCLEYDINPRALEFIARIYQFTGYEETLIDPIDVAELMEHIISCDAIIDNLQNI